MKKLQWMISLIFIISLVACAVDIGIIQIIEHPALMLQEEALWMN